MRAVSYWQNCELHHVGPLIKWSGHHRDVFWVLATLEEAEEHIVPHMDEWGTEDFRKILTEPKTVQEDSYLWPSGEMSFFVPSWNWEEDPPRAYIRIYPYSGMWNGSRPWVDIGPVVKDEYVTEGVKIAKLDDLVPLGYTLHNRYVLVAAG